MQYTTSADIAPILGRYPALEGQGALMPVLQDIQDELGYLPEDALERVAEHLGVAISHIYGVVSFYAQFSLTPRGKHIIKMCLGTACHIRGGRKVLDEITSSLGIADKQTTGDGVFTLEVVRCLGTCFLAPVIMIDSTYYGALTSAKARKVLESYRSGAEPADAPDSTPGGEG
jgi:NADH:ubiquinone oxidoreductase subunit E